MKNLLCLFILFISVSINAQTATVTKVVAFQENDSSEKYEASNQSNVILGPIITKEMPVVTPNSVASLYPNPVEDQATIELDKEYKKVFVNITDISGNIVQENSFSDVALIQFEVELPKGVYTMNAVDENKMSLLGNKLFIKK